MIEGFEVKVKRTGRKKTASIHINPEKTIEVAVPSDFSNKRVENLLTLKHSWIISKISELNERPKTRHKEFVSGESFTLFGKQYRLKVLQRKMNAISIEADRIVVHLPRGLDKEEKQLVAQVMLLSWYKEQAEKKIKSRLAYYSKKLGLEFSGVSIKDFNARWGSCSPKGHISVNWRLAMAPTSIIDYVIVHELIHLEIKSHSSEYWSKVGSVLRDYRERRVELKRLHSELYSF